MRRNSAIHICSFSALDELPKNQRGNTLKVLSLLHKVGRFSCFEVEGKLCDTITYILGPSGYIESTGGSYPWTTVKLSEKGLKVLEESA